MTERSDKERVSFNRDDPDFLNRILTQYEPLVNKEVRWTADKFSITSSQGEYQDLLQEAQMALYKAYERFDDSRSVPFGAFAKTCIHNALISFIRKRNSQKKNLQKAQAEYRHYSSVSEDNSVSREQFDRILRLISSQLSDYEKDVLKWYSEGKKPREIAQMLGRSPKSVWNAISRMKIKAKQVRQNILNQ